MYINIEQLYTQKWLLPGLATPIQRTPLGLCILSLFILLNFCCRSAPTVATSGGQKKIYIISNSRNNLSQTSSLRLFGLKYTRENVHLPKTINDTIFYTVRTHLKYSYTLKVCFRKGMLYHTQQICHFP